MNKGLSLKFALKFKGPIAQLVEQFPFKELVLGSSPSRLTESDSASPEEDEVVKYDLAPRFIFLSMIKTSDVLLNNKYYIYVLFSLKDHKFYIGFTTNLKNRLIEHANGLVVSTRNRRPLKLIHYEYFIDKPDAKSREVFLKSGFGRSQLKEALKRTLTKLNYKNLSPII